MSIVNDVLSMVGFGSPRRRSSKSKKARLNKLNRKLDKKLEEKKLETKISQKKKRLGIS